MFELSATAREVAQVLACGVASGSPLGGLWLRAPASELREAWLGHLRETLQQARPGVTVPWVRIAGHVSLERVQDSLDLAASLQRQQRVMQTGALNRARGGVLVLSMAEHVSGALAAAIMQAIDQQHFTLIAMDEGVSQAMGEPSAALTQALAERLELVLDGSDLGRLQGKAQAAAQPWGLHKATSGEATSGEATNGEATSGEHDSSTEARAINTSPAIVVPDHIAATFVQCALAFGLPEMRLPIAAMRVARLVCACQGQDGLDEGVVQWTLGAVMLRRARQLPAPANQDAAQDPLESPSEETSPPPQEPDPSSGDHDTTAEPELSDEQIQALSDQVIAACLASVPAQLLLQVHAQRERARASSSQGTAGARSRTVHRGRPVGERRAMPRGGARLHVLASLRAAAPWQALRRKQSQANEPGAGKRLMLIPSDLHVYKFEQHAPTLTLFVVDASGSAALHRLNEAKGAVELLLADCYVRRDQVALIAFRAREAQCVLAPTRSLVAAKKQLAQMPAGGGTPLATALQETLRQVRLAQRAGQTPLIVLLTDGRANIGLDGQPGREAAHADAMKCARLLAGLKVRTIVLDTSAQASERAEELAGQLRARYLTLPHADARQMSDSIRAHSQV
jgi:magnesium chelatase subunit D